MNNDKIYLTVAGKKKIQEELRFLVEEKRPELVERLANARSLGDLNENSDYISAKEELAFTDGRIDELEEILLKSTIIKEKQGCQQVTLGCKVTIESQEQPKTFHLVGEWEADPASAKISHASPLGKALMGKKAGEQVEFEAPAGKIAYIILAIE